MITINRRDFQYSRLKVETMSMTLRHVLSTEGPSQPLNHYNYAQLDLSENGEPHTKGNDQASEVVKLKNTIIVL